MDERLIEVLQSIVTKQPFFYEKESDALYTHDKKEKISVVNGIPIIIYK